MALLDGVGGAGDAGGDRLTAAFHQAVGVEHQGGARRHRRLRLRTFLPGAYGQRPGPAVLQQFGSAVGADHDGRRVTGAGVAHQTGDRVEHATEDGGAGRARQQRGEPVQRHERPGRARVLQQQRAAGAAQLTHHRRGPQPVSHAVADHDADPPVRQLHGVVPVAADLERHRGRGVPHRETGGELRRAEDRPLQGQRGLPLLVDLVHPVQPLGDVAGQQRQQRLILLGEGPLLAQVDPERHGAVRVLDGDAGAVRTRRHRGQQRGVPQREQSLPALLRQRVPPCRRVGGGHLGDGQVAEDGGEHAGGAPQLAQLVQHPVQRVGEVVGL